MGTKPLTKNTSKLGLVLNAGGARGAYQAGVLKRVGEIPSFQGKPSPFPIIAGASAGAINGAALASGSDDFSIISQWLASLWMSIKADDIFKTNPVSLVSLATTLLKDLSLGGLIGGGHAQSLLDATPLKHFLKNHLKTGQIQSAIDQGHLYALAITATDYFSGKSFAFIQGKEGHPTWSKSRKLSLSTLITVEHVCASAAIPIVFQPVSVRTSLGTFYFGDGGLRHITPLSPAIYLGADRLFAIGIRSQQAAEERLKANLIEPNFQGVMKKPPLAQIIGIILNAIFLDHLDMDIERLIWLNNIAKDVYPNQNKSAPIRAIDHFSIFPSVDLAKVAETHASKMPPVIRYFMEGLGASQSESSDLMSYLLFDKAYTTDLVEIGYQDSNRRIDEIEHFLRNEKPQKLRLVA